VSVEKTALVARFLSPAWLDDLATAADGASGVDGEPVTVEQVVTGAPGGDVRYRLRLGGGRAAVLREPGEAEARLRTDWATAVALGRGELAATDALLAGRLRVGGDVRALRRAAAALAGLDALFAEVRGRTTWE